MERTKNFSIFPLAGILLSVVCLHLGACEFNDTSDDHSVSTNTLEVHCGLESDFISLSADQHKDQMYGFWLGQSIGNWTGLVTEMDKIGNVGDIKTGAFYTRNDWGGPDQPSIWGQGVPSDLSDSIDFVFADEDEVWGADDDTDLEYMYQYLMYTRQVSVLTPQIIKEGWLHHIYSQKEKTPFGIDPDGMGENFLWVSNQHAYNLMEKGLLPPETGFPENNPHYDMIDAQLTTEIFGLFAPGRPDIALQLAYYPIRTTASKEAAEIAEFYVVMHSLAPLVDEKPTRKEGILWMADSARSILHEDSYPAAMYDYVKTLYLEGVPWEEARDLVYQRYQVEQQDGYTITSRKLYCNGCFAAGINFSASLISLFYGEGDIVETIKIATLAGWDSDNPAATWGGLLGYILGRNGIEKAFGRTFSGNFHIHRTRRNFPGSGIDTFDNTADSGLAVTSRVLDDKLGIAISENANSWHIPMLPCNKQ